MLSVKTDLCGAYQYYGGTYYKYFTTSMTWQAAKDRCEQDGGTLAEVKSQDEQDFITGDLGRSKTGLKIIAIVTPKQSLAVWHQPS